MLGSIFVVGAFGACVEGLFREAPPKIAALPPTMLAIRLYAFGASAEETRQAFAAVKQNNPTFSVVNEGGDGDVLVGLENDSPRCVPPTALCSFKISYRIRDNRGEILTAATTTVSASSDKCSSLCAKALNNVVVKVVEAAAGVLKSGSAGDASTESVEGGLASDASAALDGANDAAVAVTPGRGAKKTPKPPEPPPKPQPAICVVGSGPHLPSEEAEKRAAQVEVLKRLSLIDQDEYDCLRKAYLARL